MGASALRSLAQRVVRALLGCRMRQLGEDSLARPAVVFAPHPDDETLGCGGTIIRKRRAGAPVRIVFVTDGSMSHPRLMPPEKMRELRAAEALAAARALEVDGRDVVFLGLPDGRLSEHEGEGAEKAAEVLRSDPPAEVFVPYHRDGPPDHLATTRLVLSAMRACGQDVTVYEYPVWFWYHWPWTALEGRGRQRLLDLREGAARLWRLWRDCNCFVRVGEVLDLKRAALARHRSQVERLLPDTSWLTLGDIAGGDFLACFFQDREIFHRHRPAAHPPGPRA